MESKEPIALAALVAASPDGILAFDREYRYTVWNPVMERISGLPAAKVLGRVAWEVFPFLKDEGEDAFFEAALAGEARETGDRPFRVPESGREGHFRARYAPVRDAGGGVIGGMAIVRESTDARRAEESRALLDTLFRGAPVALGFVDRELRYRRVNDTLAALDRSTPEEMLGRTLREVLPELADTLEPLYRRVLEHGVQIRDLEVQGPRPGHPGQTGYWLTNYTPVRASDGETLGVAVAALDITDRKRAEVAQRFLGEASAVLAGSLDLDTTLGRLCAMIVERLADACAIDLEVRGRLERVAVLSRDPGKVRIVDELERRYPTPLDSPAGHTTAFRTGEPQLYSEFPDELLRSASVDDEHFRLWKALEMTSVVNVPLIARGRPIGVLTLVSHTPGRIFGEEDLRLAMELARRAAPAIDNARLYRDSQEANRVKSEFLSSMTHELRTPLNAIVGYADLLQTGVPDPVPAGARQHAERIALSARHLVSVIDEILTFSRIAEGRERVRPERVDAAALAREAASIVEPLARAKRLDLRVTGDDRADIAVISDPGRVRQILINLLGNAVKFTAAGEVELSLAADDEQVVFAVRDTGVGIAPEDRDRIFDPFWQADQSTTRTAQGTGLGLTVSQRLARLLGGDIDVDSAPGLGSTFTLRIPRSVDPEPLPVDNEGR